MDLKQAIMETAACAATAGAPASDGMIRAALHEGRRAARYGCNLPLFVTLDVMATLSRTGRNQAGEAMLLAYPFRATSSAAATGPSPLSVSEYEDWLSGLCRHLLVSLSYPAAQANSHPADFLPVLMNEWERLGGPPAGSPLAKPAREWVNAYDELLADGFAGRIGLLWSGSRSVDPALWKQWWPDRRVEAAADEPSPASLRPPIMLGLFSSDTVHEDFDLAAGFIYEQSDDLVPDHDQRRRIRQLRQSLPCTSIPFTTAYEEPDPRYGIIALSTLSQDEAYVDFHFANETYARINNRHEQRPPRRVHVHLAWICGYGGIRTLQSIGCVSTARLREGTACSRRLAKCSQASVLQACVLLVLDDWRELLAGLPITYSLHRSYPKPVSVCVGRGGRRWKCACGQRRLRQSQHGWPAGAIQALLRRTTCVDTVAGDPQWQVNDHGSGYSANWWCGCATAADLRALGFRDLPGNGHACMAGPAHALPSCFAHVVRIDDAAGTGTIYGVRRDAGELHLVPTPTSPYAVAGTDPSFIRLRSQALDTFISVLERIMVRCA